MKGDQLDIALKAAGMITVSELLQGVPFDAMHINHSIQDNQSLYEWVVSERRTYSEMRARHDLKLHILSEDVYDFILGRLAQLTEIHVNMRKIGNES